MPRQRERASASGAAWGRSNNGIRRSRVADLQRTRLLSAMLDVCAERGAANVTVADVVSKAGVSRRTFYELFDDREDCLVAALDWALEAASGHVLDAYGSPSLAHAPWRERIRAGLIALLEFLEDEPLMGHMLIVSSLGAGRRIFERRSVALAQLMAAVDDGRSATPRTTATDVTAEATVGAVLSVIHARLLRRDAEQLLGLVNPLMSMIVLPYLGAGAARRELQRHVPARKRASAPSEDVLKALEIRVTYRTMSVLMAIAENPKASNRQVARIAGVEDQGQISKLLSRLEKRGLIENIGGGQARGTPNAWRLSPRGEQLRQALGGRPAR